MATYDQGKTITLPAGENLDGDIYETVKINSSGGVIKTTATTDLAIGVLAENPGPTVAGDIVTVAVFGGGGILKAKAAEAITAGEIIAPSDTAGRVDGHPGLSSLVDNRLGLGVATQSAVAGEVFSFVAESIGGSGTL